MAIEPSTLERKILNLLGWEQSKVSKLWHHPECLAMDISHCTCQHNPPDVGALTKYVREIETQRDQALGADSD